MVYGTGSCSYANSGTPGGTASLASPTSSLGFAAAVANNGTVWCKRGSVFLSTGILSTPAIYKPHGTGNDVIFR